MRPAVLLLIPLVATGLRADVSLNAPVPLAVQPQGPSQASAALSIAAADRALELGFPKIAADLYRQELDGGIGPAQELNLRLATALLDDGRAEEAERTLRGWGGSRAAPWYLRIAMSLYGQGRLEQARKELASVKEAELPPGDMPWKIAMEAQFAALAEDRSRADELFRQARRQAPNELVAARIILAQARSRLRSGGASQEAADQLRQGAERFGGTATGYDFARSYAAMLAQIGNRTEAIAYLERQVRRLPAQERSQGDDFRLLLGFIAGGGDGSGRAALVELMESGSDPDQQRAALELLSEGSRSGEPRTDFRRELDRLIGVSPAHPILEDLLLYRAEYALEDKDYAQAEDDCHALLEKFPGLAPALRTHALVTLAGSSWEQRRFRAAADYASRAREADPDGQEKRRLEVLVAEAWFRAGDAAGDPGDFRNAAQAYQEALGERPAGLPAGDLMFQAVESLVRLSEQDESAVGPAQQLLDRLARDPSFDVVNRWRAEWNLARALQIRGRTSLAYARVNAVLLAGAERVPSELKARMGWLQAQLSFDSGAFTQTLRLAGALQMQAGALPDGLRADLLSTAALLSARAYFALGRESEALAALERLRSEYPGSDAAAYSYLIAADYYSGLALPNFARALQLLNALADSPRYRTSPYAPYALYQAALLDERLGQEKNLKEADRLLDSLVRRYPASDLVFYASLRQGDLLRELNQYPQAADAYARLVNHFSAHRDAVLAQLALAECYSAQSGSDPSFVERARNLFEHLCDRRDAPVDVRVEAGFSLGDLLRRRGSAKEARADWWERVVGPFLLSADAGAQLGPQGRYWMSRTLIALGDLEKEMGSLEEAKRAWALLIEKGLPYQAIARERLAPYPLPEIKR